MHGGATPAGIASSNHKTGRHSKYLPQGLADAYEEALADPELARLSDELALVDSLIAQALGEIGEGATGALWRDLRRTHKRFKSAEASGDELEARENLDRIGTLIDGGSSHADRRSELLRLVDQRRRLVEGEARALERANQFVTKGQLFVLVDAVAHAVRLHVQDRQQLARISREIEPYLRTVEAE